MSQSAIQQIKELIQEGEPITERTRDVLMLNAIVDIYEQLQSVKAQIETLQPALRFYKTSMWVLTGIVSALITLAASGRVQILIK